MLKHAGRKWLVGFAVALLLLGSFLLGFVTSPNLKGGVPKPVREQYLSQSGGAPPEVRAGVLEALRAFQAGYERRDTRQLEAFMSRLFPNSDDILLLGTDAGEWTHGYREVSAFIGNDWRYWGDFKMSVDGAVICSSGDVAWVATVGVVRQPNRERPARFTAILTRSGDRWLFRQVHFQWDERDPRITDLLHRDAHRRILAMARGWIRKLTQKSEASLAPPGNIDSR